MCTKFNDYNDMNTLASDAISECVQDGYRIDAKESIIDREKDKHCTFKAVLKKDVYGIECKRVVTLSDNGDDKNKLCIYHKLDTVGGTKWHEETHTFSSSGASNTLKEMQDDVSNYVEPLHDTDNWLTDHRKRMKRISDVCGLWWDLLCDNFDSNFKRLSDATNRSETDIDNRDKCSRTSACKRLDDYISLKDSDISDKEHIKVNSHDTVDDLYNKIVNKRNDGLKATCSDKQKTLVESSTNSNDDELEDSLVKLVRYIFGS